MIYAVKFKDKTFRNTVLLHRALLKMVNSASVEDGK